MMKMIYKYSILCSFLLFCVQSYGQYSQSVNKHVIVTFDNALPTNYRNVLLGKTAVLNGLAKEFSRIGMKKGDYYSLVNFGINSHSSKSIEELAVPIKDKKGNFIVWRNYDTWNSVVNNNDWFYMIQEQGINRISPLDSSFSLLTGAKAYSLTSVNQLKSNKEANRTFIIMVTDDHYNGNDDYNKEFSTMIGTHLDEKAFESHCYDVSTNYRILFQHKQVIADGNKYPYSLITYEVTPAENFSLSSVLDYPANLGLHRIRGGYKIDFDLKSVSNDVELKRFEITYTTKDENEKTIVYESLGHVEIPLSTKELPSGRLFIQMRAWFKKTDSLYNGVIMSPYDSVYPRLYTSYYLDLKEEAQLLGVITIPDYLWPFTDDTNIVVLFWSIISILILIIICFILIRWLIRVKTTYNPSNDALKIKRIN